MQPNIFHDGHNLKEWSTITGIRLQTIYTHLRKAWPIEKAVTTPSAHRCGLLTYDGLTLSTSEWSRRVGLQRNTVRQRIEDGWTVAEALGFEPRPHRRGRRKRKADPGVGENFL